jgi:histone demethylase JARID1
MDPGLEEFKELISNGDHDMVEKKFWEYVENSDSGRIKVEYAADLPYNKYACQEAMEDTDYKDHPWNFNKIHMQQNSVLQFCKDKKISGITMSWLYVGMMFSSFCWHYEDLMMYSLNYMHEGAGKIWYAIPDYHREKFERLAKDKLACLFNKDPNLLHNINVMIDPTYLVENGVHVYRTLQRPGEIVLTFPESYHQGVSVGFNISEAVNMACPSWLDFTGKAMKIYMATREKIPVFPVEWMLIENARFIRSSNFDKENI